MTDVIAANDAGPVTETYTLWQLVGYMLGLGTWGFGGPVALVGYMYRDLVEKRRWFTEGDYREGLTLAQLMPGPLAAQLAIYLGYVHHRVVGATLVGLAFVLPSFFMVVALGAAYVAYGGIGWMQSVFYGVGAAVIGHVFWPSAVAAEDAEERLRALERRQLVRRNRRSSIAGELEYGFVHALLRDVAYEQIPRAQRMDKHIGYRCWLQHPHRHHSQQVR